MSIGEESHKGTGSYVPLDLLAATAGIRFHGNIEGAPFSSVSTWSSPTASQATSSSLAEVRPARSSVARRLSSDLRSKLGGLLVKPALKRVARMDRQSTAPSRCSV